MRIHILGNEYAGSGNAGRIMEEIRLLLNNHEVTSSRNPSSIRDSGDACIPFP